MKLNEYATKNLKKSSFTLNEDWFDDDNFIVDDAITDEAPEKESPKNEVDTGISNLLIDAIKDEFETIKLYNSIIEQIRIEDREDIISILQDIVNEENVHVGQLQKALELYSPNADSIEHGSQEAEEQMKVESINEGIKNLDRVVSGKKMDIDVDIPLDMADAIVAHEQTEKDIKDAMKEVEGSAKEVSDKKETKKVSTPEMKKMKLSEELFTEDSDGWNIAHTSFNQVLDRINDLDYEVRNCIKGAYTNCYSYEELGEYIRQLGMDLMDSADEISELSDDDEFEESLDEDLDYDIYPGEYRVFANRYGDNDTYKADSEHLVFIDARYLKTNKGLENYINQCKKDLEDGYYDEFEIIGPDNESVFAYPDEFNESLNEEKVTLKEGRKPEELSLFDQVYNEISADMDVEARHRKISNKEFPNKRRFNFDDVVKFTAGAYPEEDSKSKRVDKRNAKIEPRINRFILEIDGDDQKEFLKKVADIYRLELEFKGNKAYLETPEE